MKNLQVYEICLLIINYQFILVKINAFFSVKDKNLSEVNKTYDNNRIKQYPVVEYLGCCLDANLSGESMAIKSFRMINTKLQFLYRENQFLNPKLSRVLCNFLIQPHFDYVYIFW